jgi:hypothetical protein
MPLGFVGPGLAEHQAHVHLIRGTAKRRLADGGCIGFGDSRDGRIPAPTDIEVALVFQSTTLCTSRFFASAAAERSDAATKGA